MKKKKDLIIGIYFDKCIEMNKRKIYILFLIIIMI